MDGTYLGVLVLSDLVPRVLFTLLVENDYGTEEKIQSDRALHLSSSTICSLLILQDVKGEPPTSGDGKTNSGKERCESRVLSNEASGHSGCSGGGLDDGKDWRAKRVKKRAGRELEEDWKRERRMGATRWLRLGLEWLAGGTHQLVPRIDHSIEVKNQQKTVCDWSTVP